MIKRKIFWISVTIFTLAIIATVITMFVLTFEKYFPIECDISEEWFYTKIDFVIIAEFFDKYPGSKFENKGNLEKKPNYCLYSFKYSDSVKMEITVDKHQRIQTISVSGLHSTQ